MPTTTLLTEIVQTMQTQWTSFSCIADGDFNMFHYGYPQEVDDIHNKVLPLMVLNYPTSTSAIPEYEGNRVDTTTTFTLQIYGYGNNTGGRNFSVVNSEWDRMEDCFYIWLQNVLNTLGSRVVMGSGSVSISRRDQGSNDQIQKLDIRFNMQYYRYCLGLIQ
tara:strand:- start:2600 stop:3085 length:486 start_codon:yes stop_codon:yes gene_type:complete